MYECTDLTFIATLCVVRQSLDEAAITMIALSRKMQFSQISSHIETLFLLNVYLYHELNLIPGALSASAPPTTEFSVFNSK